MKSANDSFFMLPPNNVNVELLRKLQKLDVRLHAFRQFDFFYWKPVAMAHDYCKGRRRLPCSIIVSFKDEGAQIVRKLFKLFGSLGHGYASLRNGRLALTACRANFECELPRLPLSCLSTILKAAVQIVAQYGISLKCSGMMACASAPI